MVSSANPIKGSFTFQDQEHQPIAGLGGKYSKLTGNPLVGRSIFADDSNTSCLTKDSAVNKLPRTYHDLQKKFVVALRIPSLEVPNIATGEIVVSKIP
jgi:hypothetical protein